VTTWENWENRFKWEDTIKRKNVSLSACTVHPNRKELENLIPRLPTNKELLAFVHTDKCRISKVDDIFQQWSCTFDIQTHQKINRSYAPTYTVLVENGCLFIRLCLGYRKYIEHCWHLPKKFRSSLLLLTDKEAADLYRRQR